MRGIDPGSHEQEPREPVQWEDWRPIGPLLAKRHAAGLQPMANWAWTPIKTTTEWVRLSFVGDPMDAPIGAAIYLRLHDGAILQVGSPCYFYGLFKSNEDVVAAIAQFDSDADPEQIEHHIHKVLLEAHFESEEAAGRITSLGKLKPGS